MKKLLLIVLFVFIFCFVIIYFFIPDQLSISRGVTVNASSKGILRALTEKNKWQQWWPDDAQNIHFKSSNFRPEQQLMNRVAIDIVTEGNPVKGIITVAGFSRDSSVVFIECSLTESSNPLEKIGRYFAAGKIRSSFTKILEQLKSFTETSSNLYGMKINNTKVKDQFLVSIKESLNKAPANSTIYSLIEELEYYINQQNAKPTAHPMLHVDSSNTKYEVMVAIPVNKPLQGNSRIQPKRMVLGNILEAEVKGGPEAIKKGKIELNNYREDYDRTSPAIPYESLVTNRLQERDSSKWITRLYYPVF